MRLTVAGDTAKGFKMTEKTKPVTAPYPKSLSLWLADTRGRGLSSEAIVMRITDIEFPRAYPHHCKCTPMDASDVGRCVRLLRAVPEIAAHFQLMRDVSTAWSKLVDVWSELEAIHDMPPSHPNDAQKSWSTLNKQTAAVLNRLDLY